MFKVNRAVPSAKDASDHEEPEGKGKYRPNQPTRLMNTVLHRRSPHLQLRAVKPPFC
jgi:hypothetical protein